MSNTKKDDLPAMPFYVGDWLKAPDIQCLSYELKGIWFEMLCFMWESKERGVILYSDEELSRLLRLPEDLLKQKLQQLYNKGIYSIRESDGAIFSRRMIKDQNIREIRKKSGQMGGFATHFAKAKTLANSEDENEIENKAKTPKKRLYINTKFIAPTLVEVQKECLLTTLPSECLKFIDFYQSKGWKVGNAPMKDWKASWRNWQRKNQADGKVPPPGLQRKEEAPINRGKPDPKQQEELANLIRQTSKSLGPIENWK